MPQQFEDRIADVKAELVSLGRMRPGSLSRRPAPAAAPTARSSYSRAGKLHCDTVRPDYETVVRAEIETYRRYRELTRLWIDLELELSRLKQRRAAGEKGSA